MQTTFLQVIAYPHTHTHTHTRTHKHGDGLTFCKQCTFTVNHTDDLMSELCYEHIVISYSWQKGNKGEM